MLPRVFKPAAQGPVGASAAGQADAPADASGRAGGSTTAPVQPATRPQGRLVERLDNDGLIDWNVALQRGGRVDTPKVVKGAWAEALTSPSWAPGAERHPNASIRIDLDV
jgi:hypothetical protein